MEFKRISNIDLLYKKNTGAKSAVVVLHGYGASMQDLAPLYEYLDPASKYDWYFLDGNLSIDVGYGMVGKAWFNIDMYKLQMALATGKFEEVFEYKRPEGIDLAVSNVEKFIRDISTNYIDGIMLGGFSQGSMVSLAVALKDANLVKKLFLLSSTLFDENHMKGELSKLKNLPVFQSHGESDPILPFNMALKLNNFLRLEVHDYKFVSFRGGHEIPLIVINGLKEFLAK